MLFEGTPSSEIASALNISEVSVSNVRRKFVSEAKENGLMETARAYGIDAQVNDLVKLRRQVNAVKGGFDAVERGIKYAGSFEKVDVKSEDVSGWIDEVYEAAVGEGLDGEKVGPLLSRFSDVTGESELGYRATLAGMEEARAQRIAEEARSQELKAEIIHLNQEKVKADSDAKAALASKGLTQEKLDQYTVALSSLKGKVDIEDTVSLSNLVNRLVQEKQPYDKILEFYKRDLDIEKERKVKTSQNAALDESRLGLETKIRETKATLDANKETVALLNSWREAGLDPARGTALMRKVEEHAALRGLNKGEALTRFYSDLEEHWSPSLGFANEHHMLSGKVGAVKMELSNTQDLLKETKRAYDSTMSAVEAKEALNKRGVGDDELIAWDGVLRESGTDVHSFRDDMKSLGGSKAKVEKMRAEERKTEGQLALLKSQVEAEKVTYNQFIAANIAYRNHFDDILDPLLENVQNKIEEIGARLLDEKTGIEPQLEDAFNDATGRFKTVVDTGVKDVSNEIDTLIGKVKTGEKDFDVGVKSSITKVDAAVTKWEGDREKALKEFYELGEGVQRYKVLADVLSVLKGQPPEKIGFTFSFAALLDAISVSYGKTDLHMSLLVRDFRAKLLEDAKHGELSLR